jgi:hypothetical protein
MVFSPESPVPGTFWMFNLYLQSKSLSGRVNSRVRGLQNTEKTPCPRNTGPYSKSGANSLEGHSDKGEVIGGRLGKARRVMLSLDLLCHGGNEEPLRVLGGRMSGSSLYFRETT